MLPVNRLSLLISIVFAFHFTVSSALRIDAPPRDDDACILAPPSSNALVSNGPVLNISTIYIEERGAPNTNDYFIYYRGPSGPLSPFHDIPLYANEANKIFHMIVEIPRFTNSKMEIYKPDPLNPIKQDTKKGKLRYVKNCFPYHGYMWNYGAIPQTWENPNFVDESTGMKGDNDPIDIVEIGQRIAKRGELIAVKILGVIGLVDQGETDWKLISIDVNDPLASQLNDVKDVEHHMPGFLRATVEWFRIYKIPDGKPANQFAFNGAAKGREFAHKILLETHDQWRALVEGRSDPGIINITSVSFAHAKTLISVAEAENIIEESPEPAEAAPWDPKVDAWHFVSLS